MAASSHPIEAPRSAAKPLALVGIVLALAAPLITWFLNGYFAAWFDNNGRVLAGLVSFWVIVAVVLLISRTDAKVSAERNLWQSLNLKRVKLRETLVVMIIGFVTLFVANLAYVVLARTIFPTDVKTSAALTLPLPLVFLAWLTGALGEEILYRGYALERLQRITGNWWVSGGVTWALFVGFHIPAYPMAHIVGFVAPSALALTLVYIWKRNLTYTVLIHGILDLPILLAAILIPLVAK
jgi:membrane protease YdiL (CAAX protease family)